MNEILAGEFSAAINFGKWERVNVELIFLAQCNFTALSSAKNS